MVELHLRQLEARRVREATPLTAAEVRLRARELAHARVHVRAGPRPQHRRPELAVVRARKAPAEPAGV